MSSTQCAAQMLPTTNTHPFDGPLSRTTRVSRYQKKKHSLIHTPSLWLINFLYLLRSIEYSLHIRRVWQSFAITSLVTPEPWQKKVTKILTRLLQTEVGLTVISFTAPHAVGFRHLQRDNVSSKWHRTSPGNEEGFLPLIHMLGTVGQLFQSNNIFFQRPYTECLSWLSEKWQQVSKGKHGHTGNAADASNITVTVTVRCEIWKIFPTASQVNSRTFSQLSMTTW